MRKIFCTFFCIAAISSAFAFRLPNGDQLRLQVGLAGAIDTRIVDQSDRGRSNFVFEDRLAGLNIDAFYIHPKSMSGAFFSITGLYPLQHRFNTMVQKYKNVLNWAVDVKTGYVFEWNFAKIWYLEGMAGLHYNFLFEDRWLCSTLGVCVGPAVGIRTRTTKKHKNDHAVFVRYYFCYDFGDFGTNRNFEPYMARFSHQIAVAYSF